MSLVLFLDEVDNGFNVRMGLSDQNATVVKTIRHKKHEQVIVGISEANLPIFIRIIDADTIDDLFKEIRKEYKQIKTISTEHKDRVYHKCKSLMAECLSDHIIEKMMESFVNKKIRCYYDGHTNA